MNKVLKVLLLEDNEEDAELIIRELNKSDLNIESKVANNESAYIEAFQEFTPDIILSDYELPHYNGMQALKFVQEKFPNTPFIIVTGSIDEETAARCIKKGAWDYVIKNNLYRLIPAIRNAIELHEELVQKKHHESELINILELNRVIIDNSKDLIQLLDLKGNLLYMNKGGQEILHIDDITPYLNKSWIMNWKSENQEKIKEAIQKACSGKTAYFEGQIVREEVPQWWSVIVSPIFGSDGKVEKLLAVSRDISERKKAEEELLESEVKYRTLVDQAPEALFLQDMEGQIIEFNSVTLERYGFCSNELLSLKTSDIDPFYVEEKDRDHFWNELQLKKQIRFEGKHKKKDGTIFPVEVSLSPIVLHGKRYILALAGDISDRKKAENKFETYVTNSPTAFFIVNNKGDYGFVNSAACELLGYSKDEFLSMNIKDISHPDDYEKNLKTFPKLLEGKPIRQEISMLHKSGKKVYSILDAVMLDEDNVIAFCTDTTQRHRDDEVKNVLYKISEAVNTASNLSELYRAIHKYLSLIINTTNFYIVLYDNTSDVLKFSFHADEKVTFETDAARHTLSGYVIKTGKTLYADEKTQDRLIKQGEIGEADAGMHAKIWIGVPLRNENETIGVIAVQSYSDENAFSKDDVRLLELVSNSVAMGIQRKLNEKHLQESEEKYRSLVNNLPIGISRSMPDGKFLSVNPAIVEMYGYSSAEELMNASAKELYCDIRDRDRMLVTLKKNGFLQGFITQEKKKDGSQIWVSANYKAKYSSKGEVEYLDGVILDITKRKKAQEALKQSEQKLRETVDAIAEGVWEVNLKTNDMYLSPQYYYMLGYKPEDFKPSIERSRDLIHPDDRPDAVKKEIDMIETRQESYVDEYRMVTKTGGYRWIRTKGKIVEWDENDKPFRMIGSHEDITFEKLAEMEIKRSQENFLNIAESNIDGILILDDKGTIVYANPAAIALFGGDRDELIGTQFEFSQYKDSDKDIQIKDKKGALKFAHLMVTKVKWEDSDAPLVVLHDITQHKEFENKLKETNAKLEEIMAGLEKKVEQQVQELRDKDHIIIEQSRHAAMGEMIGNIAHQWRQPLTAVGAIVQDIEEAYKYGELNEKYLKESIETTMGQIEYMSRTIDDFRNFFLPNKEKELFSINNAVDSTVHFVEGSLKHHEISIELNIHDECKVTGFKNEYTQVILNILNNAKDAIKRERPANPKVMFNLKKLEGKYSSSLSISNNAGQIPENIIKKIFDPYFTTKHEAEGTGLGLYMSKTIIEKNMGGLLTVENIKNGVKFTILL